MKNRLPIIWIGLVVIVLNTSFVFVSKSTATKTFEEINEFFYADSAEEFGIDELTLEIAAVVAEKKAKKSSNERLVKNEFAELSEKRYKLIKNLIDDDPAEFLRVALPKEVLENISTEYRDFFEQRAQIKGSIEIVAECEEIDGRTLYYLNTERERLKLYFAALPENELQTGASISIDGVRLGDDFAIAEIVDQTDAEKTAATEFSNIVGEQKILTLLVNFQNDQRQPYTADQVSNLIYNQTNGSSVTSYYREASYRQTTLTGDVRGWLTLPINSGDCGGRETASYAKQAAASAGINLSLYDKFVYIYPNMSSCGYSGFAVVGGTEVWINGSVNFPTITHELGHSFGLYHAKALDCGAAVIGGNCTTVEYGNMADVMGAPGAKGHFHAYHKERLGFLNDLDSPPIHEVQTSGTYFVSPLAAADSSAKALKILKSVDSNGAKTFYYAEFRRPLGFDNFLSYAYSNSNLTGGLMMTASHERNGAENFQIDMTPETASWADSALTINRSYTDTNANFTITLLSADSSGALVEVSFGSQPAPICVLANPTISVNPTATQWIGAGSAVNYSVTVKNNNSASCTANTFNLQTAVPGGWSATTSASNLSAAPGASAATNVKITSPASATADFYTIGLNAANAVNSVYSASIAANLAIYSALDVSVAANQPSYTSTQTVNIAAGIAVNKTPQPGTNVAFTITRPNGTVAASGSSASDANGTAMFIYRFNRKKDVPGTYQVSANAHLNGVSGTSTTSFVLSK